MCIEIEVTSNTIAGWALKGDLESPVNSVYLACFRLDRAHPAFHTGLREYGAQH